jgi:hypothetical protein
MDSLIKEMALRSNDINFDDFDQFSYRKCLLTARRIVAKRYSLIQRIFKLTSHCLLSEDELVSPEVTKDIELPFTNFTSEYKVLVNNEVYNKVDKLTANSEYEYVLGRDHNKVLFNYWLRNTTDEVKIYFVADINEEDSELEEYEAIIPSQYNEEIVSFALVELSKLGIVKFANSEKGKAKYQSLFQLYNRDERSLDRNLIKNKSWITIKTWQPY